MRRIRWIAIATVLMLGIWISTTVHLPVQATISAKRQGTATTQPTAMPLAQENLLAQTPPQPTIAQSPTQSGRPARIIFFHIDGLHYQTPERLKMTNYQSLVKQGTSVDEAYILIPWHQTENGYRSLSLTSPPNPTTMAGSIFLDPWWEERYVQHAFIQSNSRRMWQMVLHTRRLIQPLISSS